MLEFALRYTRLGWPVLPLRDKLPLVEHGSHDATTDEAQVRAWWERWPNANIGLATGHKFFAVDVDVKAGGEETWDLLRSRYGRAAGDDGADHRDGRQARSVRAARFCSAEFEGQAGAGHR
jgi:hypothetical protein